MSHPRHAEKTQLIDLLNFFMPTKEQTIRFVYAPSGLLVNHTNAKQVLQFNLCSNFTNQLITATKTQNEKDYCKYGSPLCLIVSLTLSLRALLERQPDRLVYNSASESIGLTPGI